MSERALASRISPAHLVVIVCAARGAGSDRRLLLAGAHAGHDDALGPQQQRGRLDHRHILCGLHRIGADPGHAHRSARCQARLSVRRWRDGHRASPVRPAGRRVLVGARNARAHRHGVGRDLHDRPEAPRRPGRRQADGARDRGARGEHRHLRRALVCLRRPLGKPRRLENRVPGREPFRGHRLDHGCAAGATPWRTTRAAGRRAFQFPCPVVRNKLGDGLCARPIASTRWN